jgi:hypothetical protein
MSPEIQTAQSRLEWTPSESDATGTVLTNMIYRAVALVIQRVHLDLHHEFFLDMTLPTDVEILREESFASITMVIHIRQFFAA